MASCRASAEDQADKVSLAVYRRFEVSISPEMGINKPCAD